jgi:integrase
MVKTIKQGVFYQTLNNGNKSFYIKYSLNNKQYKAKLGLDIDGWTAHKAYKEREKRISNNISSVSENCSLTFEEAFNNYINNISHKSDCYNTISRYNVNLKNDIGHLKLHQIKPMLLLKVKERLSTQPSKKTNEILAKRTINGLFDLINQVYNFHIRIEYYKGESPSTPKLVERYKNNNTRLGFLSKEDYDKLIFRIYNRHLFYINTRPYITEQLLWFVKLAVTTGARRGTLITIKKKDICFDKNTIALYNHKLKRAYQGYIHPSIKNDLSIYLDTLTIDCHIIGGKPKQLSPSTISKKLQPILNDLFNVGVTDRKYKIVLHSLRHTFGSWLAQANTSLYHIMKLMDHSRIEQTQMYSKLLPNSGAEEVSKIDI